MYVFASELETISLLKFEKNEEEKRASERKKKIDLLVTIKVNLF